MQKHIPTCSTLLLAALALATLTGGCASTAATLAPNRQYLEERAEPPALGLAAETEDLTVTLETVITPGGPGSWYKDAKWDEYVLTFRNSSTEPVRITSLDLVDQRGVYVASERSIQTVSSRTGALVADYKALGINMSLGVASQVAAFAAYGYAGATAAAAAPVALVAAPAYLLWRRHARAEDRDRTEDEFQERQLPPHLHLAPGGTITGSAFSRSSPARLRSSSATSVVTLQGESRSHSKRREAGARQRPEPAGPNTTWMHRVSFTNPRPFDRREPSMNNALPPRVSVALAAALALSLISPREAAPLPAAADHRDPQAVGTPRAPAECLEACPTLASGAWPVDLQSPTAGYPYTPTLYDADGDGAAEIFVTGGETFAIEGDGSFVPGWPTEEMPEAGYGTTGNLPGPSVANVDNEGSAEVVWSLRDWFAGSSQLWTFNARHFDGSNLPGFPRAAPDPPSNGHRTALVLGDLDGDQTLEACAPHSLGGPSANRLSCLDQQSSVLFTFDVLPGEIIHSSHLGDVDGNGTPETFLFSYHLSTRLISLYVLDAAGSLVPGYPKPLITIVGHPPMGPFVAWDADGNGDLELFIAYGSSTPATVDCYHHTGSRCTGYPLEITALDSQVLYFTLGDLTGDGRPEILMAANDMVAEGDFSLHAADVVTGAHLPGWPITLPVKPTANPTCADVTNDGKQDFLVTLANDQVVGYSFTGAALPGFPLVMSSTAVSGAAVGDIDGDGLFEIVAATWDGFVYAWDTVGEALPGRADWPMRSANSRNTGILHDPEVVFRDGFESGDTSAW